jgi:glycosyltransferase involved in cell wall biosynthesis
VANQEMTFVHLTHSDPRSDARVLKQMRAGVHFGNTSVVSIGREDLSLGSDFPPNSSLRFILLEPPVGHRNREQESHDEGFREFRALERFPMSAGIRHMIAKIVDAIRQHIGLLWLPIKLDRAVRKTQVEKLGHRPVGVIQVHDFLMLRAGATLKKITGAKLIYDAHELESSTLGLSWLGAIMVSLWERTLWKHIDGFITVSEGIREVYFTKHRTTPSRVILNSPQTSEPSDLAAGARLSIREELGLPKAAKIFVYLGYLSKGRGIELALEAFPQITKDIHCVFVGTGDLADLVEASAAKHQNIHLVKPVPHTQVVGFISSADFGLCLIEPVAESHTYALPNKLFECAVAGLPVLGSSLPEISRIIRDYDAGTVTNLTVSDIIVSVKSMANSSRRVDSSAVEELTWARQVEKLHSLYADLLSR